MQLAAAMIISGFFTALMCMTAPYEAESDNVIGIVMSVATVFNYFCGLGLLVTSDKGEQQEISNFMMLVQIVVIIVTLYTFCCITIPEEQEKFELYMAKMEAYHKKFMKATGQDQFVVKGGADKLLDKMGDPNHPDANPNKGCEIEMNQLRSVVVDVDVPAHEGTVAVMPQDMQQVDASITKYFERYTMDTGILADTEDFHQCCINLCVQLNLPLRNSEIDDLLSNAPAVEWDLDTFKPWFQANFIEAVNAEEVPQEFLRPDGAVVTNSA